MDRIESLTHCPLASKNLVNLGAGNILSHVPRQAIIWSNAASLLIIPLGTNFSGILIKNIKIDIQENTVKMSAKRQPFCKRANSTRTNSFTNDMTHLKSWHENIEHRSNSGGYNLKIHSSTQTPELERTVCKIWNKQRFLTPGHQGWNDLHSLCRIGMEYYLLNNDDNNDNDDDNNNDNNDDDDNWNSNNNDNDYNHNNDTNNLTIMKMIMIKTAQTPCQSLYKDRRI